jgi:ElaB/YqjD/DUF883 family membrane-anchored ribosome-binding protein
MMITRNNYEEFFLLYADNELSAAERKAVEEFVNENADLQHEFAAFEQLKLKPENNIVFENKNILLKVINENAFINHTNYEEYFLLYADNELNEEAKKSVEEFANENAALKQDLAILLQTRLEADNTIVFEHKESLYKKSDRKIILLPWMRIAAAAIILLMIGLFVFNNTGKKPIPRVAINTSAKKRETKAIAETDKKDKKDQQVVTSSTTDSFNIPGSKEQKLAVNPVKKMKQEKNIKGVATQNQPANNNVAVSDNDLVETNVAAKINKQSASVERVDEKQIVGIIPPSSVTLNTADLVADTTTPQNDIDAASDNIDNDDKFYIANTSSKKNKFRGFFRQVSRTFAKATHTGNDNNDAILIGSFRVALK